MHIFVSAKGNGDPWVAGKIKDHVEEFGYGGAPVRIKSDQEPAIVDVQMAVIAKRGNAPTILVNSPRWRFSIQRTSGKRNQEGLKYGENNPFKFGTKVERQSDS